MTKKLNQISQKLVDLLEENEVWYKTFLHNKVKSSIEAFKEREKYGYEFNQGIKSMIVKFKNKQTKEFEYAMLCIPADCKYQTKKAKKALNTKDIRFINEIELKELTGGVKSGGVPPFGGLFKLPTFIDKGVFDNEKVIFNAGDRGFSISILTKDYILLSNAREVELV